MQPQLPARPDLDQLENEAKKLVDAVQKDDSQEVRRLLDGNPELRARINDPLGPFDSPVINGARSREMIDALDRGRRGP